MCNGQNLKQLSHACRSARGLAGKSPVDIGGLGRRGARLQGIGPGLDPERLQEIALLDDAVSPSRPGEGCLGEAMEIHMGGEIRLPRLLQGIDGLMVLQRLQGVAKAGPP
jgi:hypothetical protein